MEVQRTGSGISGTANINTSSHSAESITSHPQKNDIPVQQDEQRLPQEIKKETLEEAAKKANEAFKILTTHIQFKVHEDTGKYYVSVINDQTQEVIREIPPKKFLDMMADMKRLMKGIFVDEVR